MRSQGKYRAVPRELRETVRILRFQPAPCQDPNPVTAVT